MRVLLIAATLLAPGTAWAASGDIGCIEAKLGPAVMQRIGDGVIVAFDRNTDPSRALDTDRDALIAAREACRTANGWSTAAVAAAVSYTQARATRVGAEAALRRDGLDAGALGNVYAQLATADRRDVLGKPSSAALNAIEAASPKLAVRLHVMLYFAALSGIEFFPADFAAA